MRKVEDSGIEIEISTTADEKVRIEFKKPLKWLSMNYIQALALADILVKKAKELEPRWKN